MWGENDHAIVLQMLLKTYIFPSTFEASTVKVNLKEGKCSHSVQTIWYAIACKLPLKISSITKKIATYSLAYKWEITDKKVWIKQDYSILAFQALGQYQSITSLLFFAIPNLTEKYKPTTSPRDGCY